MIKGEKLGNEYHDKISAILQSTQLRPTTDFAFKNFFGAVTGYVNGQIFCSYGKFGFALKLPAKTIKNLHHEPDVKHLKYFPKGHIKKDYLVLPTKIIEDKGKFKTLVGKSIDFVLSDRQEHD